MFEIYSSLIMQVIKSKDNIPHAKATHIRFWLSCFMFMIFGLLATKEF